MLGCLEKEALLCLCLLPHPHPIKSNSLFLCNQIHFTLSPSVLFVCLYNIVAKAPNRENNDRYNGMPKVLPFLSFCRENGRDYLSDKTLRVSHGHAVHPSWRKHGFRISLDSLHSALVISDEQGSMLNAQNKYLHRGISP